jgi:hypothetical protein
MILKKLALCDSEAWRSHVFAEFQNKKNSLIAKRGVAILLELLTP